MDGRQLTRSQTDKRIAGVCGGLGDYFGIDPTLVRIGAVVLAFMGPGLLAYIVLWIVLPKGTAGVANAPPPGTGLPWQTSSAVRIAEDRFARGEITAEDLKRIRNDLQGG